MERPDKKIEDMQIGEIEREMDRLLSSISDTDRAAEAEAAAYQESLVKPPGSLGRLEEIAIRLSGITGRLHNRVDKRMILVLCADNGVIEEGVSSAPQSVTLAQARNMTRHLTGMSCLAKEFACQVRVVDVGIGAEYDCPAIVNRSLAKGTKNIAKEPAMTRETALKAILMGADLAREARREGIEVMGVGEMGIGNTTTSAAVLSALTGLSAEQVAGRGGGLTDVAFARKKEVIEKAIALHRPDAKDPVDVLSKLGGLDLAAMCGVFLGGAAIGLPLVVDGFISIVAALCAVRLCPLTARYLFLSHASHEIGFSRAAGELGLSPYLLLDMRLGEGSGCPLAFEVMRAACAVMNTMATFAQGAIEDAYLEEIRRTDSFQA